MTKRQVSPAKPTSQPEPEVQRPGSRNWRRQIIGVAAGALVGQGFVMLAPRLGIALSQPNSIILWAGAIGGVLSNLDGFINAGAKLTRREGKEAAWFNLLVAFLGILALVGLTLGLTALLQRFLDL